MFSGRFPGRVECDCFHVLMVMRGVDVTLLGKCFNFQLCGPTETLARDDVDLRFFMDASGDCQRLPPPNCKCC